MSWLKKHWIAVAGTTCGLGAGLVGWFVSPDAGMAAASACTVIFGVSASKAYQVIRQLTPQEKQQLQDRQAVQKSAK